MAAAWREHNLEMERSRSANWSVWTALKIGNALFPGLALPIGHLVTLRLSKAPITVCESAASRCLQPGKHFSVSEALRLSGSWGLDFSHYGGYRQGHAGPGLLRSDPTCRLSGSRRRSGCIPAEPYPPLEHQKIKPVSRRGQGGNQSPPKARGPKAKPGVVSSMTQSIQ